MRLVASVLVLHERLLEVLRGVEVPSQLLVAKIMQLRLDLILLGRACVVDLGRVIKILGMLRLQLALVCVRTRAKHVLGQGTSQVHLRLDEGLRLLQIDLLGCNGRSDHVVPCLLLHLEQVVELLVRAHGLPRRNVYRVGGVVR